MSRNIIVRKYMHIGWERLSKDLRMARSTTPRWWTIFSTPPLFWRTSTKSKPCTTIFFSLSVYNYLSGNLISHQALSRQIKENRIDCWNSFTAGCFRGTQNLSDVMKSTLSSCIHLVLNSFKEFHYEYLSIKISEVLVIMYLFVHFILFNSILRTE